MKVVALIADGTVVARASVPTPRDAEGLSIEGRALLRAVDELVLRVCGDDHRVAAISCAGVGEDGMLVDAGRTPLTPALAWFDPRRQGIFRALRPALGPDDDYDAETDPVRALVGWSWSRAQPSARDAAHWVALADLPGVTWAGTPFLSDTLAARTAAWRSHDRSWAQERVTLTLGSPELLPPVLRAGDVAGELRAPALRAAGVVAPDAIVVAGGHDHPIGGWGVDQVEPGAVLDSMGTAEVVVAQSPIPGIRRRGQLEVAPGIASAGSTLLRVEELARNVAWASQDPEVAASIGALLAGTVAPLPILDDGYFVPGQRGGGTPAYALGAPRDPHARASAVLGGLARIGRDAVDAVLTGLGRRGGVRLAGGWVRSPGWIEIKNAVNGYRTEPILEPEVTAVGAALLAARALGWAPDPNRAFAGPGTLVRG